MDDNGKSVEKAEGNLHIPAVSFKMICANCMDFDAENNTCTIRYLIHKDKTKSPMTYSELNNKEKWTKSEALKMMLYCVNTLKVIPSKKKIIKAKNALSTCH